MINSQKLRKLPPTCPYLEVYPHLKSLWHQLFTLSINMPWKLTIYNFLQTALAVPRRTIKVWLWFPPCASARPVSYFHKSVEVSLQVLPDVLLCSIKFPLATCGLICTKRQQKGSRETIFIYFFKLRLTYRQAYFPPRLMNVRRADRLTRVI